MVTLSPTQSPTTLTVQPSVAQNNAAASNERAIVNEYIALVTTIVIFVCICVIGYFLCIKRRKPKSKLSALQARLLDEEDDITDLDPILPDGDNIQLAMNHTNTYDHIEALTRNNQIIQKQS